MKFKSVLEMVKKLSSNSFYNKWIGNWPRRIIENYQFDPVTCISSYQEYCRFYPDDYKEQEEIRKEWLLEWQQNQSLAQGITELFIKWLKNQSDNYFENRWLRRN